MIKKLQEDLSNNPILAYQKIMTIFVGLHVVIFAGAALLFDLQIFYPVLLQSVLAIACFAVTFSMPDRQEGRDIVAMAMVATPAVLVFQLTGHVMQLDAHMYFFATLAMLIGFKSIRSVLFATVLIALHHLILNFLYPYAVFPEGANFLRVVFHAVIVIVETAVIVFQIRNTQKNDQILIEGSARTKEAMQQAQKADEQRMEAEQEQERTQRETQKNLANTFDNEIGRIIGSVDAVSEEIQEVTQEISQAVHETRDKGQSAVQSSGQVLDRINAAVTGVEALSANISNIAQQLSEAADTTRSCAEEARASQTNLDVLQVAIDEIDIVLKGITDVAEQTNLLALNATIEAARAGEAGKGFSVVANEVKVLSSKTHDLTDEIAEKVTNVKDSARKTIEVIQHITSSIEIVDEETEKAVASIKSQNEEAHQININVKSAAEDTQVVANMILEVEDATDKNGKAADRLEITSNSLSRQASTLKSSVATFLKNLK